MSLPYVYYQIKAGSPADIVVKAKIESTDRVYNQANKIGDTWLGSKGVPFKIVLMDDCNFCGFRPDKWHDATEKLGEAYHQLWIKKENSSCSWMSPRRRPSYPGQDDLIAAVATIPVGISWESVSHQLFGTSRFVFGMRMCNMTVSINEERGIFGVPWLATQGASDSFGPPFKFKVLTGLTKLPFEKAMVMLHGEEAAKRKKACEESYEKYIATQKEKKT